MSFGNSLKTNLMSFGNSLKRAMCATLRVHMAKAFLCILVTFISLVFIIEQFTIIKRQTRETEAMSGQGKAPAEGKLVALNYEVFGKVQGVFFRKNTEKKAKQLGIRGWIINTKSRTVKGELEGDQDKIQEMKKWLEKTGSPMSSIDKAVFTNERRIEKYSFDKFSIKH